MVVIATYNGGEILKNIISDIKSFGIPNNEICIVDNQSTDRSHLQLLNDIQYNGMNVIINETPSYEIGAFKYALDKLNADYWFCFHDSIRLKQNIFEMVTPKLTNKNVYTFLTFNDQGIVENFGVRDFLKNNFQRQDYRIGIFGNMFFATNEVAQLVKNDWIIPSNKWGSMYMEIGMGIIFDKHNIEIIGLDIYDSRISAFDGSDAYPFFTKLAKKRQ